MELLKHLNSVKHQLVVEMYLGWPLFKNFKRDSSYLDDYGDNPYLSCTLRENVLNVKPIIFGLTVRCMAGGRCGLSAEQFRSDRLRLRPDPCRRRRTITNATDAPASTVAADNAPTSKPITRWPPVPVPISFSSRFFVCWGKPENHHGRNELDFNIFHLTYTCLYNNIMLFYFNH